MVCGLPGNVFLPPKLHAWMVQGISLVSPFVWPLVASSLVDHACVKSNQWGHSPTIGSILWVWLSLCTSCVHDHGSTMWVWLPHEEEVLTSPRFAPYTCIYVVHTLLWWWFLLFVPQMRCDVSLMYVSLLLTGMHPHGRRCQQDVMGWFADSQ